METLVVDTDILANGFDHTLPYLHVFHFWLVRPMFSVFSLKLLSSKNFSYKRKYFGSKIKMIYVGKLCVQKTFLIICVMMYLGYNTYITS